MPATSGHPMQSHLGHISLMMDTFIANVGPDDLRAILRTLLAKGGPSAQVEFATVARQFLQNKYGGDSLSPKNLFTNDTQSPRPTQKLSSTLGHIRALYGIGMGFASLSLLDRVVEATSGLKWEEDGEMAEVLAVIDADITQAIQSSKEELSDDRIEDTDKARSTITALTGRLRTIRNTVQIWGGQFPFERALDSLEYWKV